MYSIGSNCPGISGLFDFVPGPGWLYCLSGSDARAGTCTVRVGRVNNCGCSKHALSFSCAIRSGCIKGVGMLIGRCVMGGAM